MFKGFKERKHPWIVPAYGLFYTISFMGLEQRDTELHIIHCGLDDMIPFCPYFIVPYMLWFAFVLATVCYFTLRRGKLAAYWHLAEVLMIGMTVFLAVSLLYPNGQELRPELGDENWFVRAVKRLYLVDTPTNVLPSLHVFNAVSCCVAICKDQTCKRYGLLIVGTRVLTVMIVLSTMFLKQHSVVDVCFALMLYGICYQLVYNAAPQSRRKPAGHSMGLTRAHHLHSKIAS